MVAKAWVVRGGRRGEQEQYNIDSGRTTVGWADVGDLGGCQTREDVQNLVEQTYPGYKPMRIANITGQLWAFRSRVEVGDLIVMPLKTDPGNLRFGRVTGGYGFDGSNPDASRQKYLPVEWDKEPVPKAGIASDLLNSLNALMTVFSPSRNDAYNRLLEIASTGSDPGNAEEPVPHAAAAAADEDEEVTDPETIPTLDAIQDRVRAFVTENFKEHELTWLVAEILEVHGYACQVSPPGPDGGVDILAGQGPLGMDSPIVVVEVKSEPGAIDTKVVRGLHSARERHKADQALLVAWGGLNGPARREIKLDPKFQVWDGDTLLSELFHTYGELSASMQARIPLRAALVLDEDALG
ncbi:restriction endonuclease (plasmid) [Citricoccus nitrophenolicus]